MKWLATWTQAVSDLSGLAEPIGSVTLRIPVTATHGGTSARVELSNKFGSKPLIVGATGITCGTDTVRATFSGEERVEIPAGETRLTDRCEIHVVHGDPLLVDLYLPEETEYSTANFVGAPCLISTAGDFVGVPDMPLGATLGVPMPDGSSLPLAAPILRSVEVAGSTGKDVVVCIGDSITAGGWPQVAATLLPPKTTTGVVNRGVAGNRLLFDGGPVNPSFGDSGLSRFDEDVLATSGATAVIIALGTNDIGLPGADAPISELPSAAHLIGGFERLVSRAQSAGLAPIIATITPFMPAENYDEHRELIRQTVNAWIRSAAPQYVDFDAAVRSAEDPTRLADDFDGGDHLHPNEDGVALLARAAADTITTLF